MIEQGNAIEFIGDAPSNYLINLLRAQAGIVPTFEIRCNDHQACWVSNPSAERIAEFPIVIKHSN